MGNQIHPLQNQETNQKEDEQPWQQLRPQIPTQKEQKLEVVVQRYYIEDAIKALNKLKTNPKKLTFRWHTNYLQKVFASEGKPKMTYNQARNESFLEFVQSPKLKNLEHLIVWYSGTFGDGETAEVVCTHLKSIPNLKEVTFYNLMRISSQKKLQQIMGEVKINIICKFQWDQDITWINAREWKSNR